MRGGGCLTCRRRLLEAAGALFALTIIEGRSRHTCGIAALRTQTSTCCLALDARRLSTYLFRHRQEAAVAILAASPWMRGGCVDIHASSNTTGGGSRPNCCLPLDARRLLSDLFRRRQDAAVAQLCPLEDNLRTRSFTCSVAVKKPQSPNPASSKTT